MNSVRCQKRFSLSACFLVLIMAPFNAMSGDVSVVTVSFARTNGLLRPLHGVNLGPLCYRGVVDLSAGRNDPDRMAYIAARDDR